MKQQLSVKCHPEEAQLAVGARDVARGGVWGFELLAKVFPGSVQARLSDPFSKSFLFR